MTPPKTTVRFNTLWQRVFIFTGWSMFALLTGAALLAAMGLMAPPPGANSFWMVLMKSLIWPAAGHAIAGYIEHRTQRNLQASQVWIPRAT